MTDQILDLLDAVWDLPMFRFLSGLLVGALAVGALWLLRSCYLSDKAVAELEQEEPTFPVRCASPFAFCETCTCPEFELDEAVVGDEGQKVLTVYCKHEAMCRKVHNAEGGQEIDA